MSSYKNLIPIALILFAVMGCYVRLDDAKTMQNQYNQYLADARQYREGKIYVDALENYNSALAMKNTYELCLEVGDMMIEQGKSNKIESWGKYLVEQYPKNIEGYEYLVNYYLSKGNYSECFSYYDITQKRGISSDTLTATINSILYEYRLGSGSFSDITEYINGYAVAFRDDKYGYVNESGNFAIEPVYTYAGLYNGEYAPIQDEDGEFYFIDIEGNRRLNYPSDLNLTVTRMGCVGNGLYSVGDDTQVYIVSTDGNIVAGPFSDAGAYSGGINAVSKDGKWYLADLSGSIISDAFEGFVMNARRSVYVNGIAFAKTESGYIMVDSSASQVGKTTYEDARCFNDNTYAAVKTDGKWGFVDNTGKMVIEAVYEDALSFSNGFAAVKKDGLWGYITIDGEMAIEPTFDDAQPMNSLHACYVKANGQDNWAYLRLIRYEN